jgi:hypothetical protein
VHGRGHAWDVNDDGRPDMLLHYDLGAEGIGPATFEVCLAGGTVDGCRSRGARRSACGSS